MNLPTTLLTELIDQENWNVSHFKQGLWRAQITFGADIERAEIYFVTLMDQDFKEHFQRSFDGLESAIADINERYGKWAFVSDIEKKSDSGCSSCQAH